MKNLHQGAPTRVNQHLHSSRSSEVINWNTKVATVCKNVMELNKKQHREVNRFNVSNHSNRYQELKLSIIEHYTISFAHAMYSITILITNCTVLTNI